MVFQRKYIFSFDLTLLPVDNIAKFVSAFTRVFVTLFTKYDIRHRTDSLLQSKDFMVADEICCAESWLSPLLKLIKVRYSSQNRFFATVQRFYGGR